MIGIHWQESYFPSVWTLIFTFKPTNIKVSRKFGKNSGQLKRKSSWQRAAERMNERTDEWIKKNRIHMRRISRWMCRSCTLLHSDHHRVRVICDIGDVEMCIQLLFFLGRGAHKFYESLNAILLYLTRACLFVCFCITVFAWIIKFFLRFANKKKRKSVNVHEKKTTKEEAKRNVTAA